MARDAATPPVAPVVVLIFAGLLSAGAFASHSVTLAWDPNPEPDLSGYRLHYGTDSGVYNQMVDVGNQTTATVSELQAGTYYFAVTAYNTANLESLPSNEVSWTAQDPTFLTWQTENATELAGQAEPGDNPDGDLFSNALEYAFGLPPGSGANGDGTFKLEEGSTSAAPAASFDRPAGLSDVTYTLQVSAGPDDPDGWSDWSGPPPAVVDNGDGTETVSYPDLDAEVGDRGIARLEVEVTGDTSGPHLTPTFGWDHGELISGLQTMGVPYARESVFSGTLSAGAYDTVLASIPADGADATLVTGGDYYVEFIAGDFAGHRLEVSEGTTTGAAIAIDTTSSRNTLSPVPPLLAGGYAVRPHIDLDSLLDPASAVASDDPASGDRIFFLNGGGWITYWVTDIAGLVPAQWTEISDPNLGDAGSVTIDAAQGLFAQAGGFIPVTQIGVVREWPFACPLQSGFNLVGSAFPVEQSPMDRAMFRDDGDGDQDWFQGANDPLAADQIMFWAGDSTPGADGYITYFRLFLGVPDIYDYWTDQTTSELLDADNQKLFKFGKATLYKAVSAHDRSDPDAVWLWPPPVQAP